MRATAPLSQTELLAQVVRGTSEGVAITTADLADPCPRIVYVNPAFCRMTGYEAQELLGEGPGILQSPTGHRVPDDLPSRLLAGAAFRGQVWNDRKDGGGSLLALRIDPILDPDGTTTHCIAFLQEVLDQSPVETDRPEPEAALAEERERIRLLVEHLPVVTYSVEQDGPDEWEHPVTGTGMDAGLVFVCRWVPLDECPPLWGKPDPLVDRLRMSITEK